MGEKIITEVTEIIDHPLEDFFDITPNTTEITKYEQKTELVKNNGYDQKDDEIEENFQEILDKALSGYKNLQDNIEDIDPKYISRAQEVANQLLTTALQAAAQKADLKKHKDKLGIAKNKKASSTINNNIIMDTNTLIKHLKETKNSKEVIDVVASPTEESIKIEDDKNND